MRSRSACSPRSCIERARARVSTSTSRRREVVAASSPDALLAEQLGVPWAIRVGNHHREFAPHDVYPAAGEDDWVAIAVGDESEWAALCTLLDCEELVPRYPTADARRVASAEIDDAIGAWTRQRSSPRSVRGASGGGRTGDGGHDEPVTGDRSPLVARDVFVDIDHPELGRTRVMRQPWLFSGLDVEIRHGPLMGQDNDYVLDTILELSTRERADVNEVLR